MRRMLLAVPALAALVVAAPLALGQKPPKGGPSDLTIDARPSAITFGQTTTVSGMLRTQDRAGKKIDLQSRPHGDNSFNTIASTTTETSGAYSFAGLKPTENTRYRVIARVSPPITSAEVEVPVRMRVSLRLSDYTPSRCERVRFSGSVQPEHDGRLVYIQRRSGDSFRTVARTTLRDAGTTRSVYARRVRVCRDGVYRSRVLRDADHATGTSRTRTANVP
jgi:hypothetical protein